MNYPELFEKAGGCFLTPPAQLSSKLKQVKVLLFDWDGVFHSGHKNETQTSSFSEADAMGVNMLRFGYFLLNGRIPFTAIVSGENNPTARHLAMREHFDAVYLGMKNKIEIIHILKEKNIALPEEVFFVFDDILDLGLATRVGARAVVNRPAGSAFKKKVTDMGWADYQTFSDAQNHAVREVCEMVLTLLQMFDRVVEERSAFTEVYHKYIGLRNSLQTQFHSL